MKKITLIVLCVLAVLCFVSCSTAKTGSSRLISEINSDKKGMAQKELRMLKNAIKSGSYSVVYSADGGTYRISTRGFTIDEGCRAFMTITATPDEQKVVSELVLSYKDKTPLNVTHGLLNIDGAETDLGSSAGCEGPEPYTQLYTEKLSYVIDSEMYKNLMSAFGSYRTVNIQLLGESKTLGGPLPLEASKTFQELLELYKTLKRYYG